MTADPVQRLVDLLDGVKPCGADKWQARCPAHDDRQASLSIGRGDDGRALVHCHAGCATADVLAKIGLSDADLFLSRPAKDHSRAGTGTATAPPGRIVKTYDYANADGKPLYQVVRYEPKGFRQRRPDGNGGWIWNLNGVPRVLYRLPELLAASKSAWVFVVEGEKDADTLAALGLVATTNPGGAGKWSKLSDDSAIHLRRVAVIPDRDRPDPKGRIAGRDHAEDVARRLHGKAADVRIIDLGAIERFPGKDVTDWVELRDSQTPEELAAAMIGMAEAAPPWTSEGDNGAPESAPMLTCLADVRPEPVKWFWPQRIALGKVTLLVGDPGLGKSFVTLDMAARVTKGTRWPDCPDAPSIGGVVLLSAEDDLADTIRPRSDAAGADVRRIQAMTTVKTGIDATDGKPIFAPFNLAHHLPMLEAAICQVADCRLVIIDPISAYLGRTDSHKNADVRGLLAPLAELAARRGVAVVAVSHLRKGEGPAMYRAMGSLAFVAAARAAYCVTKDKDDPTGRRRLFLPIKNNLGNDTNGLAYQLDPNASGNGQPVVAWEPDPVSVSADEALNDFGQGHGESDPSELDEAKTWLQEALANGPKSAREVIADAEHDGFSKRTLDRAKKALNVAASKSGFGGGWKWRLPGSQGCHDEERQEAGQVTLATFGDAGNLRDSEAKNCDLPAANMGRTAEDCQRRESGNPQ